MPRIESVYLTFSGTYPHVFFVRRGKTGSGQYQGFYPTTAQLSGFAARIRALAWRGRVTIHAHDFGWVAERCNERPGVLEL